MMCCRPFLCSSSTRALMLEAEQRAHKKKKKQEKRKTENVGIQRGRHKLCGILVKKKKDDHTGLPLGTGDLPATRGDCAAGYGLVDQAWFELRSS